MAYENYGQIYRDVLVYAPATPLPMAKKLVRDGYRTVIDRYRWSSLRKQSGFNLKAPFTSTDGYLGVTNGLTEVRGDHTLYLEAITYTNSQLSLLQGMQLVVGGKAPYYTVVTAEAAGTLPETLLLYIDRTYTGTTDATTSFSIQPIYLTTATDFDSFISVVDVANNWRIRTDVLQEVLDKWDANRSSTGTSWVLSPAGFNTSTATGGREDGIPMYEIWPRPSAQYQYPYRYYMRSDLVNDGDVPIWPISHRTEILKQFALSEIAKWPGTKDKPNPYFNVQLYSQHKEDFLKELYLLQKQDQEVAMTDLYFNDTWSELPFAPVDAKFAQSHAY